MFGEDREFFIHYREVFLVTAGKNKVLAGHLYALEEEIMVQRGK